MRLGKNQIFQILLMAILGLTLVNCSSSEEAEEGLEATEEEAAAEVQEDGDAAVEEAGEIAEEGMEDAEESTEESAEGNYDETIGSLTQEDESEMVDSEAVSDEGMVSELTDVAETTDDAMVSDNAEMPAATDSIPVEDTVDNVLPNSNPEPAQQAQQNYTQPDYSQPSGNGFEYIIRPGDSLSMIARAAYGDIYGWQSIAQQNGITNPDRVLPGDVIQLDANRVKESFKTAYQNAPTQTITVQEGDTLSLIAEMNLGNSSGWKEIWQINRGSVPNPNLIYAGQKLTVKTFSLAQYAH